MRENQGYYSLIQYSEFPERVEYVNIGICLFSMAYPHALVKFSESPKRVEHVFGVDLGVHYGLMKESINSRIKNEFGSSWSKSTVDRFIELRSGKVRLSKAFSVSVVSPVETLNSLFEKLVTEMPTRVRREQVRTRLKRELQFQQVEDLLEHPSAITLPQGTTIRAPYAYQNGAYNLICPVSLRNNPDVAILNAGRFAIEGRWLHESSNDLGGLSPKKLIIVGDLTGQTEHFSLAVEQVMIDHKVGFYRIGNLDLLANDIRINAHEHGVIRTNFAY